MGIGVGIALGTSFGSAIGLLMDNLAVGIGIGISVGLAIGAEIDAKWKEEQEKRMKMNKTDRANSYFVYGLDVLFAFYNLIVLN